jgi:DNA invertase Pin-like site-specific DNA recombinase
MIYGYARVSTKGQAVDGNSLEKQKEVLKENGAKKIYEDSFTGTKMDRPEFNKLIAKLKEGDTLMVTKLDRFARSMSQGSELVNDLLSKGIKVNILNIGMMDNTPSSKLIRNIFFSFAEFERDMIVERTQEGKAIAKTKEGFKEGRPKSYTTKQLDHALSLLTSNGGDCSYKEVAEITNISVSTLLREHNKRKAKNVKWSLCQGHFEKG